MTRKDFELIAYAFNNAKIMILDGESTPATSYNELLLQGWKTSVMEMASQLRKTNDRFDHDRFVTACGVTL